MPPPPAPAQVTVECFPQAPLHGRRPSGLDASEVDTDAEELDVQREDTIAHAPVASEEDVLVAQSTEALSRATALERAALAGRREATSTLAEARHQLSRLQEQQQRLCEAEEYDEAEALNASLAGSEAAVAAAESVLLAAEHDFTATALAVLAASAAELAAWEESLMRLTGPQARARKRETLEAEHVHASSRQAGARDRTADLLAERNALAAALAVAERKLAAAQLEEEAATDSLGSLEMALAALEQTPSCEAALVPPAVAARMQATVDGRRLAHAARESAMVAVRTLAAEEQGAVAALSASKQLEAAHAADVSQALAAHASAQQAASAARETAARLAAEAHLASEQKAVAVSSKQFKSAAELSNTIRELNTALDAAEASVAGLSARLTLAGEQLRTAQSQLAARASDVQACVRGLALARWRRVRAEVQAGSGLGAEADALAAEHGFTDVDA